MYVLCTPIVIITYSLDLSVNVRFVLISCPPLIIQGFRSSGIYDCREIIKKDGKVNVQT